MKAMMIRFLREEDGVTAIEYGLIAGLVAVGIVGALTSLKTDIVGLFNSIGSQLTTAAG
ncbi:Flp family type IVb pilin [Burkholderia sp. Bp8963]|uniref:Flp family type IVb pilin n=1 Tax=unclassified Burkholderia TaxID=2613784 RepID=UPI000F5A0903|nr:MULTISPECIES: Flp family type IVb pilin [unclassified Burkholderia]MBN3790037.1 Flp family type IVb pilin [Burkholderia sp. Ac-20353]RQS67065.1 Flp family type IVb pilin [Burkholderia sp. Bp8963]